MSAADTEINAIVRGIVREYGAQVLQNPKRLRAILADYLPGTPQNEVDKALQKIERGDTDVFLTAEENNSAVDSETTVSLHCYEEKVREIDELKRQLASAEKPVVPDTLISTQNNTNFKAHFIITLIIFIITFFVVLSINAGIENDKNIAQREASYWHNEYTEKKKLWIIEVTGMKVGNYNANTNKWISRPGEALTAKNIRWLNPVFTYTARKSIWLKFHFKVINPNGGVATYTSGSPAGYSYTREKTIKPGENIELDFDGFGDWNGTILPGVWTIELWNDGILLYSGKVTLN